jgi:hypothetical protein
LSYTQIADQLGTVLGPMVASLLFAVLSWEYVVLCSAGIFLAADAALMAWQRTARPELAATAKHGSWVEAFRTPLLHILHRPGLKSLIILAAALNLVIGVTLATSAAMLTGAYGRSGFYYAALQTAGAVATVLILFLVAHAPISMPTFAMTSYCLVFAGGLLTALAPAPWSYAAGFVLVVGFDKMFNVYIRSERQKLIPSEDYGKTTGLIVSLNNLSQPLAGLLVGLFSGPLGAPDLPS